MAGIVIGIMVVLAVFLGIAWDGMMGIILMAIGGVTLVGAIKRQGKIIFWGLGIWLGWIGLRLFLKDAYLPFLPGFYNIHLGIKNISDRVYGEVYFLLGLGGLLSMKLAKNFTQKKKWGSIIFGVIFILAGLFFYFGNRYRNPERVEQLVVVQKYVDRDGGFRNLRRDNYLKLARPEGAEIDFKVDRAIYKLFDPGQVVEVNHDGHQLRLIKLYLR